MDIHAQTAFLGSLVTVGIAIGVALRAADRRLALLFVLFTGNVALWFISEFFTVVFADINTIRLKVATVCAIPFTAQRFFLAFLSNQTADPDAEILTLSARRLGHVLLAGAFLGAALALSPVVQSNIARGIIAAWPLITIPMVLWQVNRHRSATPSRIERGRLSYLVLGGFIAIGFGAISLIPGLFPIIPSIGKMGVLIYLYLLSQAILRHRLLDLNELLAKLVVLSALALLLGLIYGAIVLWAGDDPILIVFNVLLVSFALMALFEPLRQRFEHHVLGIVFTERVLLKRILDGLRHEVPKIIDPVLCARHILDRLYETGRATHASFYLLDENGTGFRCVEFRGPEPPQWLESTDIREILSSASSGHKAVLRETVERKLHQSRYFLQPGSEEEKENISEPEELLNLRALHASLENLSSGVLLPLMGGEQVVGMISLNDDRVYEAYSTNEIGGLIIVADLAARVVENSKLYEKMKERDRLAALGEMAAGLAHEIRNPLGAIKAAAQYLDPKSIPGDNGEFLNVIIEEVNRLNGVVSQFLDYARPLKVNFSSTDLNETVKRTVQLLKQGEIPEEVEIVTETAEDLRQVNADPEQIKQVLINLTLNAVQAMKGQGKIIFRTGLADGFRDNESDPSAFISVSDTGPGIPSSEKSNIFIPFYTTKDKGTGLGLPICQRIIENHGGRIEVHSQKKSGSEFKIWIPITKRRLLPKAEKPEKKKKKSGK